ncbi:hypothetical protein LEP1GSC060_3698 [Leptospira weilii serovar Ranarum str. ICFT]|uniref:Uncharacterized protein n=1 Tax=Leptospira weilii serovar Ranarum str. ICFT TaxID=1218598 RepID=N1WAZ8_9LEPT|nr:hypothetical protein LEP1GSC060_3698 [Leptospira weilii serovar Ranarum str. ICFT]
MSNFQHFYSVQIFRFVRKSGCISFKILILTFIRNSNQRGN